MGWPGRLRGQRRLRLSVRLLLRYALWWWWLSVSLPLPSWLTVKWQGRNMGGRGLVVPLRRDLLYLLRLVVLLPLVHTLLWWLRK